MTRAGVRKPRPIGPAMPSAELGSGAGQVLAGGAGRRDGRRDVVEEAAVLVVVDDEHGLRPDAGVGDEDVQDLLDQVLAPLRRRGRVLALGQRREDPRHAGQAAALHVALERAGEGRGDALGDQLEVGDAERVAEVLEVRQHVEAEAAGRVAVDLPAHPGLQQRLRHRLPVERAGHRQPVGGGGDDRAAGHAGRVDPGRERHQPVRVGRAEDRAVVAVADRERVGQGVIERQLGAGEVAHGDRAVVVAVGRQVGGDERVHRPAVPAVVLAAPAVVDVVGVVAVLGRRLVLQVERLGVAGRGDPDAGLVAVLVEDAGERVRVGEACHPGQGAEVVVEAAVLLHQDHDVLDVAQRRGAGGAGGGDLVKRPRLIVGDLARGPGPADRGGADGGGPADHEHAPAGPVPVPVPVRR